MGWLNEWSTLKVRGQNTSHHITSMSPMIICLYITYIMFGKDLGRKHTHTHKTIHMNEQEWGKTGKAEFLASNKSEIWTLD